MKHSFPGGTLVLALFNLPLTKLGRAHAGDSEDKKKVLAESRIQFANGAKLSTVILDTNETVPDPIEVFLNLEGISGDMTPSRMVPLRGVGLTPATDTASIIAAATLGGYAVLTGSATPRYASLVGLNDEVLLSFIQGDVRFPHTPGFLFSAVAGLATSGASLTGGPNAGIVAKALGGQLGFPDPRAVVASSPCSDIAVQLDMDTNEALLIRVFRGSGAAPTGTIVRVCLSSNGTSQAQFQAVTDSYGLAQFNGPNNTIIVGRQTSITGVTIQITNGDKAPVCTALGSPCVTPAGL